MVVRIVMVLVVGVWGGDNVGDAVCGRNMAHLDGNVPGGRAVIHFRQDVAMDIDQIVSYSGLSICAFCSVSE